MLSSNNDVVTHLQLQDEQLVSEDDIIKAMENGQKMESDTLVFISLQPIGDGKQVSKRSKVMKTLLRKFGQGFKMQKLFISVAHEGTIV